MISIMLDEEEILCKLKVEDIIQYLHDYRTNEMKDILDSYGFVLKEKIYEDYFSKLFEDNKIVLSDIIHTMSREDVLLLKEVVDNSWQVLIEGI